ncbi:MAG: OmpH family outer membrane protein [Rhodobiaceae bacterium]|nr:OmpH family outer membrane protein [Rhodobiaceae bacterium]
MFKTNLRAAIVALAMLCAPSVASAETVILVFDLDRAIALSKAGKSMSKQLEEQAMKVRASTEKAAKKMQDEASKLREQQKLMAPEVLKAKVEELQLQDLELRQSVNEKTQAIQAGGQRAAQQVIKVAEQQLSDISKERKADIVLRRQAVFFAGPTTDVTSELVKRLDKKLKSVKVTPVAVKKGKK